MSSAINSVFGGGKKESPAPVPPPVVAPTPAPAPTPASDFASRERAPGQQAEAAGPADDGEADVLGYAAPRKRSAGRALLG